MDKAIDRLRTLSKEKLELNLRELRAQLYLLRFQNSTGQLDLNHRLRTTRVEIARILTLLRGLELGIERVNLSTTKTAKVKGTTKKQIDSKEGEVR